MIMIFHIALCSVKALFSEQCVLCGEVKFRVSGP